MLGKNITPVFFVLLVLDPCNMLNAKTNQLNYWTYYTKNQWIVDFENEKNDSKWGDLKEGTILKSKRMLSLKVIETN
ncbi:hypothetical protein M3685_11700 [Heyndrickxia oleronia]|uniref:Uncharacterized protein n=1 Tax=Heyndrickxia oleronia TaxID=38875 RepID=A0A8E2I7J3_9BACI|nr:hypothetical protein [Heyndrickxia oleronia]OJH17185.1 hypothetical protein BLX88_19350 [Bacillus obstructivus]MCM3454602.1 hypothetical protein [Heyndrickxia oleronia]MEC1377315.1 hypothetical protein [Heyndrickxia oleronia]OOP68181.1 hypothetical protein BWZ43_11800 [Heyndrickxia oleronia]QQZ03908.1 hypothetical protein I5818_19585 [Heyndrickxia oleronia]